MFTVPSVTFSVVLAVVIDFIFGRLLNFLPFNIIAISILAFSILFFVSEGILRNLPMLIAAIAIAFLFGHLWGSTRISFSPYTICILFFIISYVRYFGLIALILPLLALLGIGIITFIVCLIISLIFKVNFSLPNIYWTVWLIVLYAGSADAAYGDDSYKLSHVIAGMDLKDIGMLFVAGQLNRQQEKERKKEMERQNQIRQEERYNAYNEGYYDGARDEFRTGRPY